MVEKVKLVSGLLSASEELLERAKKTLSKKYGQIDLFSPIFPFNFTSYYDDELGKGILRQYISFSRLIKPEQIGLIKRQTIALERKFMVSANRKVNIDPGFVTLDKMVLATTKDATYRIYLGKGIYAQSTLFFMKGTYTPWQWTYKDYESNISIDFFNKVRSLYRTALK